MKDIPYLFTTLLAHYLVLKLDNRRFIKIEDLISFRNILFQKYLEHYQKYGDTTYREKWEGELSFAPVNDTDEIFDLIKNYPDIFYFKDKCLCIYENINLDFLNKLMVEKFDNIRTKFFISSEYKVVRNSLGIVKIYELSEKINNELQKIEKQLEEAYNNLESSETLIKELLFKRFILFMNILANYPIFVEEYNSLSTSDEERVKEYDYIKNSIYGENNEPYPIDDELYRKSEFYESIEELTCTIQDCVNDVYQYAIFGNGSLYQQNIYEMFMEINFQNFIENIKVPNLPENIEDLNFDELNELYENLSKKDEKTLSEDEPKTVKINLDDIEEFVFWLTYVYKINKYLENKPDENLFRIKHRLLYLLDDITKSLYLNENFENVFAKVTEEFFNKYTHDDEDLEWQEDEINALSDDDEYESDEEELPYDYLGWEAGYLIYDCFLGREYKTIEKLLLIATYYYLTNDNDIIKILNEFKDHPKYSDYEAIITGRDYNKSRKLI